MINFGIFLKKLSLQNINNLDTCKKSKLSNFEELRNILKTFAFTKFN